MQPRILAATRSRVECELHENHPLRLVGAEGRRVKCISGIAWITACGQARDIFLKPGEAYRVPNHGLVLAEAIGECRIQVDLPRSLDYSASHTGFDFARLLRGLRETLFGSRNPA